MKESDIGYRSGFGPDINVEGARSLEALSIE